MFTRLNIIQIAAATVFLMTCSGTANAQQKRYLYVNSVCARPIDVLIVHKDSSQPYHPHAWYSFSPYEESRLRSGEVVLSQLEGYRVFVYARTTDGSKLVWGGSDITAEWDGLTYRLQEVPTFINSRGEIEFKLSCPGS